MLHVVCAVGKDNIWMITSYYPDKEEWTDDFRKRRVSFSELHNV